MGFPGGAPTLSLIAAHFESSTYRAPDTVITRGHPFFEKRLSGNPGDHGARRPCPRPGPAGASKQNRHSSGDSASDLAKKLQNPIGDLYSFPFQGNTNFGVGPHSGTQENLNVQPVIPFHVSDDWNIITRTILPLVWNPDMSPLPSTAFGTAPTTFSAFLSPRNPTNGWLWGVGPVVQIPTATSPTLGSSVWGGGATGVLVYMNGPWVAGVLVNNVGSLGGKDGLFATRYSNFLTEPFVNYNFGAG